MIITFFAILLGVALVLLLIGLSFSIPIFTISGAALIMILGAIISVGGEGLTHKVGSEDYEIFQYGNNFTGYHWDYDTSDAPDFNPADDPAFLFHKNITSTDTYEELSEESTNNIGYVLLVLGVLGVAYALFTIGD